MNIIVLRSFFKWCTILNGIWLIGATLVLYFAGDWVWHWSNLWIALSRDQYHLAIYILLGMFKIFWIMFNIVPYIALVLATRRQ